MTTIIFKRTLKGNNRLRAYKLFLDGKKIGTIANGQIKKIETTPGQHNVMAKIDWWSSPKISLLLNDGDNIELTINGFKNGNWIVPIIIGIFGFDFISRLVFHINYGPTLIIPAYILLVYYLTAGQKTHLTLVEF
jgi:hypothetical protein